MYVKNKLCNTEVRQTVENKCLVTNQHALRVTVATVPQHTKSNSFELINS